MDTDEIKRRDYSKEHLLRKAKKTRLVADIEKNKAQDFSSYLLKEGKTYVQWLTEQINNALSK
jgi:hypothetical protein